MKDYNKLTTRSTNYLKNNPKPTPKKMPKKSTNQKAAGGGSVILMCKLL